MLKCDIIPLYSDSDDSIEIENDTKKRKTGAIKTKVRLIIKQT